MIVERLAHDVQKALYQEARRVAQAEATNRSGALITVAVADHACVHPVDGGYYVEATMFVSDDVVAPESRS